MISISCTRPKWNSIDERRSETILLEHKQREKPVEFVIFWT